MFLFGWHCLGSKGQCMLSRWDWDICRYCPTGPAQWIVLVTYTYTYSIGSSMGKYINESSINKDVYWSVNDKQTLFDALQNTK